MNAFAKIFLSLLGFGILINTLLIHLFHTEATTNLKITLLFIGCGFLAIYVLYDLFSRGNKIDVVAQYFESQGYDILKHMRSDPEFTNSLASVIHVLDHVLAIDEPLLFKWKFKKPKDLEDQIIKIDDYIERLNDFQAIILEHLDNNEMLVNDRMRKQILTVLNHFRSELSYIESRLFSRLRKMKGTMEDKGDEVKQELMKTEFYSDQVKIK